MTTETSLYEYAKQGLKLGADRTAIRYYGKSISYGELFEKIDNVADHLYQMGVREGTVVTIHLPNCPQAVMAIYAAAKLGAICNMVHALTPAAALRENLAFTESGFLITHLDISPIENTVTADVSAHMGETVQNQYRRENDRCVPGNRFEAMERACREKAVVPEQKALALQCAAYLHSSGSTGHPKTILLSHSALNNCVENTADFFEHGDMAEQVSLGVLPLFHGFGLAADVHRNIRFGSQLVMMARWDVKLAVQLIKQLGVTLIVGVPAMYFSLLNEPTFCGPDIKQLSQCYTGGDGIHPSLVKAFDERIDGKHHLFSGFGLTEATTMNCVSTYCHYKEGSSGYPVRNTTIAVLGDDGSISRAGQGELIISSPTLMMGYYKDSEATEQTLFTAEGKRWTRTGDEVEIDEEGFLFFRDRRKNIIIHNGYNIYPGQMEDIIRAIPGVADVCVVGVLDPALHTQNVRAVVIQRTEADADMLKEEIRRVCLASLPRYAIPGEILFRESFPKNEMGKIDRKELSKP